MYGSAFASPKVIVSNSSGLTSMTLSSSMYIYIYHICLVLGRLRKTLYLQSVPSVATWQDQNSFMAHSIIGVGPRRKGLEAAADIPVNIGLSLHPNMYT